MKAPIPLLRAVFASSILVACANSMAGSHTDAGEGRDELRQSVPDEPFLQEVGRKLVTEKPVTAVSVLGENVFCVTGGEVKRVGLSGLEDLGQAPTGVQRLRYVLGALWALADTGAYRMGHGGDRWDKIDERQFVDVVAHLGEVWAATRDELFRFADGRFVSMKPAGGYLSTDTTVIMEDWTQVLADPVGIGPVQRIASYSGTLYLLRPGGLALIDGRTFVPDPVDWGMLPSSVTRDLLALGSRLFVATDRGLGVLRGMALTSIRGAEGLPFEDITCLAAGFGGDIWIGTSRGAIRKTEGEYHYFGAQHWLPGDYVRDIAVAGNTVYIATDKGLGIIRYEPFTLLKKAAYYEREMDACGFKRLGFVHKLYWDGEQEEWLREISDNDGGHTSHYLAAMSFKYAATGDEAARDQAVEAFKAMVWLDDITPTKGFIARAVWSVKGDGGARSTRGSGGLPAKWYSTTDGLWLWKGDTSSDEVSAHFYAVSIFHDLAAKGSEKGRAAQHLVNIASHIIDNGWLLRDMDGKPTRWGRWDPAYLLQPYGYEARGLNGMEAQTYMITVHALTGDEKFQAGLKQLLEWRYQTYTVRQKLTFPPEQVVPWDDELAFFCYHGLLRYAKDPELRSIYLRSLQRTWEVLRMQQIPFYNFIYGALTGNDCEAPQAVKHLREWPLDLVNHTYRNSHRTDLQPRGDYVPYGGGTRAISPRESEAKWDIRNALQYDGGQDSKGVTPPVNWLEDYWMGRYYGFIEAPKTQSTKLLSPAPRQSKGAGAKPYAGPPRRSCDAGTRK